MEILNIADEKCSLFLNTIFSGIGTTALIGSGFTRNCFTKDKNKCYSPDELKTQIVKWLISNGPDQIKANESVLLSKKLSDVYSLWEKYATKEYIAEFLYSHYCNVIIDDEKKSVLSLPWRHLITLNIDDAIEKATREFRVILCNKNYEQKVLRDKLLIKLHGDAFEAFGRKCEIGNEYNVIMSNDSYLESIVKNKDILALLKTIWFDQNVVILGCSLNDEIDIVKTLHESNDHFCSDNKRVIFSKESEITDEWKFDLAELYHVTHLIVINDYSQIFQALRNISNRTEIPRNSQINVLLHKNVKVVEDSQDCVKHQIREDNFVKENVSFDRLFPAYTSKRNAIRRIVDSALKNTVTLVEGRRFCGMTTALHHVMRDLSTLNPIYFDSQQRVTNEDIQDLKGIKNSLVVFDSRTLSSELLNTLLNEIASTSNRVIIGVTTSENQISTMIFDRFYVDDNHIYLHEEFTKKEIGIINSRFDEYGVTRWHPKRKIIEEIHRAATINKHYVSSVFKSVIQIDDKLAVFLYALFIKEKLTEMEARIFGYNFSELSKICERLTPMVIIEPNTDNIGYNGRYKIVINCKPWVPTIFEKYISSDLNKIVSVVIGLINITSQSVLSKEMEIQAMKIDTLKTLYPKVTVSVVDSLYEGIRSMLGENPDFWHQWAKGLLYTGKTIDSVNRALTYLNKAIVDGSTRTAKNAFFTSCLLHGKKCSLQSYVDNELNIETIKMYSKAIANKDLNAKYVNSLLEEENASSQTLMGLLNYLKRTKPISILSITNELDIIENFIKTKDA